MMWSAAILAGGQARRLGGSDKSALIVDGVRFLDRQLAALSPLTDQVVLIGFHGAMPAPRPVIADRWPETGPLGALATALVTAEMDRVLVLASDLPFVTTPFLAFLASVDPAATAVVPEWQGRWQPLCAMYARRALGTITDALARGERTVVETVVRLGPRVLRAEDLKPFDADGRLLVNINTPGDVARWNVRHTPLRSATVSDDASGGDRTAPPDPSQTTTR
jgi:molybdenum cofactor guanylyltransferase